MLFITITQERLRRIEGVAIDAGHKEFDAGPTQRHILPDMNKLMREMRALGERHGLTRRAGPEDADPAHHADPHQRRIRIMRAVKDPDSVQLNPRRKRRGQQGLFVIREFAHGNKAGRAPRLARQGLFVVAAGRVDRLHHERLRRRRRGCRFGLNRVNRRCRFDRRNRVGLRHGRIVFIRTLVQLL